MQRSSHQYTEDANKMFFALYEYWQCGNVRQQSVHRFVNAFLNWNKRW